MDEEGEPDMQQARADGQDYFLPMAAMAAISFLLFVFFPVYLAITCCCRCCACCGRCACWCCRNRCGAGYPVPSDEDYFLSSNSKALDRGNLSTCACKVSRPPTRAFRPTAG